MRTIVDKNNRVIQDGALLRVRFFRGEEKVKNDHLYKVSLDGWEGATLKIVHSFTHEEMYTNLELSFRLKSLSISWGKEHPVLMVSNTYWEDNYNRKRVKENIASSDISHFSMDEYERMIRSGEIKKMHRS